MPFQATEIAIPTIGNGLPAIGNNRAVMAESDGDEPWPFQRSSDATWPNRPRMTTDAEDWCGLNAGPG
jgi:hypothetical protein